MYAMATFLIVAVITMAFVQCVTGALIATGVSPDIASFQARSAFSGAGFTTTEAENVVNHPTRRKIISTAMFVGNLGTPTLVVTVLAGLIAPGPGSTTERTLVVVSGLFLVVLAFANRPVKRVLVRVGHNYAQRRLLPALAARPTILLSLGDGFVISSVSLRDDPESTFRSLRSLRDAVPHATVLGIRRGDEFFGEPPVDISLQEGDELVLFTTESRLAALESELG